MADIQLESYATVQERVVEFYRDHPDGSIRTFAVKMDGPEVVFEARVYRTPEEAAMGIYTSGWAREVEGKSPSGRGSHLESCESSAIGRALANLGYSAGTKGPSRAEVLKVARTREEHDALLEYIKAVGPKVGDDAEILVGGQIRNLKQFVRENWGSLKEQFRLARTVVEALERATGTPFRKEAA
ncbi:MAG TPA: hypothetical protein VHG28_01385 [Longimicrobiaceae bacterium]|nr:hypothetical protein [Longimicrobiaceae bacterium]